jgi:PEP-CTERM motif
MKSVIRAAVVSAALMVASPAVASVTIDLNANSNQGTLVHGTGTETTALEVIANLGSNGPNIVHFNADTDSPINDFVRLQGGSGQADVTGAEIAPGGNPEGYNLLSGNIFLTNHAGMSWIELALTGAVGRGTVDFIVTLNGTTNVSFLDQLMGSGNTHFGFQATGGDVITNLFYRADSTPGSFDILKQVRIEPTTSVPPVVPEPATWAMMLLGIGAVGFTLRRRRRTGIAQLA